MYKDLLAGYIAGSSGILFGHPLDTLKTRIQLSNNSSIGYIHVAKEIFKKEGISAFYRGMAGPFLTAGLINSLLFSGYTLTLKELQNNRTFTRKQEEFKISEIVFASTIGTFLQIIPAIPIELIKTRLQSIKFNNNNNLLKVKGPLSCALSIIREKGLIGLYRGGTIMFWRDFIGYLFYIPVYEYILNCLRNLQIKESSTKIANDDFILLISGGLAGSLSWWIICPLELLKNRLQSFENYSLLHRNKNWREIFLQIFNEGKKIKQGNLFYGFTAFYRGGTLLALRAFPVNACIFYVHSKCLELF